jgi:hypothetical protein
MKTKFMSMNELRQIPFGRTKHLFGADWTKVRMNEASFNVLLELAPENMVVYKNVTRKGHVFVAYKDDDKSAFFTLVKQACIIRDARKAGFTVRFTPESVIPARPVHVATAVIFEDEDELPF